MKNKLICFEKPKMKAIPRWQKQQRRQGKKPKTAVNYRRQFRRKTG